jgi:hypothetical protein
VGELTTFKEKMRISGYKIVATLIGLSLSVAVSSNALAEDGYGYQAVPQAQVAAPAQNYDNNYQVPPAYNGEYYPQETEGVVAYHGTSNTSSNQAAPSEDPYYLYYY